ncbi:MAG: 30S ribosomal protein S17 [Patescibacteria group bacterium]|nr:30S ribosomal protein S17 [Patescibacteria group bacterium]
MEKSNANNKRRFEGTVVGNKMSKTISVLVTSVKIHPKYKKQFKTSKKYKVADDKAEAKIGDKVIFEECRPLSKDKRWRLIKVVK